jgi:hypothetical protein
MPVYVSLSLTRNEIIAGLVDCGCRLGKETHFGKIFIQVCAFF